MEQKSICLICLIGLPASGKTTLVTNIEERYRLKYDVDIVTFDVEIEWGGGVDTWKKKRINVHRLVEDRIKNHVTNKNRSVLLILDDNMYYRSMRYEYYQLARRFEIGFCQIYISTPLNICLKLNSERANPVAENTLLNMNAKLEAPDYSVNKWEINSLMVTQLLRAKDWFDLDKMILHCLQTPVKLVGRSHQETNSPSALHVADIALRKVVSVLINEIKETNEDFKLYSFELAKKRQLVLESVRTGEVILPQINNEDGVRLYSEFLRPCLLKHV